MEQGQSPVDVAFGVAWIPAQSGRIPGATQRTNVDFQPVSYPPLSKAPQWAQTQTIYITAATGQRRNELHHRQNFVAGVIALAIVVVGGGSVLVAADHNTPKASAPASTASVQRA